MPEQRFKTAETIFFSVSTLHYLTQCCVLEKVESETITIRNLIVGFYLNFSSLKHYETNEGIVLQYFHQQFFISQIKNLAVCLHCASSTPNHFLFISFFKSIFFSLFPYKTLDISKRETNLRWKWSCEGFKISKNPDKSHSPPLRLSFRLKFSTRSRFRTFFVCQTQILAINFKSRWDENFHKFTFIFPPHNLWFGTFGVDFPQFCRPMYCLQVLYSSGLVWY